MTSRTRGFWEGRNVFVTGGTGLMGGWLVKSLVDQGAEVVALVRDTAPKSMFFREGWQTRVNVVHGDLRDASLLRRAMCEYEVDAVFHLAAQAIVGVAKNDPVGTLETNVQGTWTLLEAARHSNVKQVVVASSDKAYGGSDNLPYHEDHPLRGTYPYDVSKSCTDLICTMYAVTYGLNVGVARCANLYGPGDLNFSRTIPGVIQSTLNNEQFLIRSDGKFIRDFLYVKDAASAYMHLAQKLAEHPELKGEAFNFSMEIKLTVLEIVEMVLRIMGRNDLKPIIQNIAKAEIREQYMTCEKARRLLDWAPHYSLEDGIRETVEWYREHFGIPSPAELAASAD